MSPETLETRALAARESDGIRVLVLWHTDDDGLTVAVEDARVGDHFELVVALDVIHHPFAHAA